MRQSSFAASVALFVVSASLSAYDVKNINGRNRDYLLTATYYRMAVSEYFAVTAELQYMKDDNRAGSDPKGVIFGIRLAAEF